MTHAGIQIRDTCDQDLPAVLAIYNLDVLQTTGIRSDAAVDLANRKTWLRGRSPQGSR